MVISRPQYMSRLISGIGSNRVKVITGIRRCGKSFLLFNLFKEYLLSTGVPECNIIEMAFDRFSNRQYRDPNSFHAYILKHLEKTEGMRFILLDEIQMLQDFSEVLIDLISRDNVDVFVTGSNAKLLSRDVVTEFRGRGQEIRMLPLSFSEFLPASDKDERNGYIEYATYGGLPGIVEQNTPEDKEKYLEDLYQELYLNDLIERNTIRDVDSFNELVDILSSSIGSLTNPSRISATFKSKKNVDISAETVDKYLTYLDDAFLITRAKRYDIKGRRYIGTPFKFYFADLGIRNARMNFRQMEPSHLMENIVYNELLGRGYSIDVGVVSKSVRGVDKKLHRANLEVDFVCNKGSHRYYIQSAFSLPTPEKWEQEQRSLLDIGDGFKKVIITRDDVAAHYTDNGILVMNIFKFLINPRSLEF